MIEPVPDPILARLEDQIRWYGDRSASNKRWFRTLKVVSLLAAGAIPVLSAASISPIAASALGAVILGAESFQQLNQYQQSWLSYRSTAENLKHEKYLYLATAGPYHRAKDPHVLLAERIEARISIEHRRWEQIEEDAVRSEQSAG